MSKTTGDTFFRILEMLFTWNFIMRRLLLQIKLLAVISVTTAFTFSQDANSQSHCSDEDNIYSVEMSGVSGDAAVKSGLEIQDTVRRKDIRKLFSMVTGELGNGPRKAFVEGKGFDQIFSEEWSTAVLDDKPSCVPVGWRGFMLGAGHIWYEPTEEGVASIIAINGALKERQESESIVYDGIALNPSCFTRVWRSGDNYEYFFEKYANKDENALNGDEYNYFRRNVGMYIAREIPLGSIASPWAGMYGQAESIAIAKSISECQRGLSEKELEKLELNSSYTVVKRVSGQYCGQLAPHLTGRCLEAALVKVTGPLGHSNIEVNTALYGINQNREREAYVVPLVNFDHENDGLNFLDAIDLGEETANASRSAASSREAAADEDISLQELVDYLNQITVYPQRYTPNVTGISVVAEDETLHYWYEIAQPLDSINVRELGAAVKIDKKSPSCELFSFGVIELTEVRYSYKDILGKYVGSFAFTVEDC